MTRDVSIHLQIEVEEDGEGKLDEFVQLKRIGDFRAAVAYFEENLSENFEHLPIAVEYAEMLFEQGAYQSIIETIDVDQMVQLEECLRTGSTALTDQKIKLLLIFHLAKFYSGSSLFSAPSFASVVRAYISAESDEGHWNDPNSIKVGSITMKRPYFNATS